MRKVSDINIKTIRCPYCKEVHKEVELDSYKIGSSIIIYKCINTECQEEFTEDLVIKKPKNKKKKKLDFE